MNQTNKQKKGNNKSKQKNKRNAQQDYEQHRVKTEDSWEEQHHVVNISRKTFLHHSKKTKPFHLLRLPSSLLIDDWVLFLSPISSRAPVSLTLAVKFMPFLLYGFS
ncbi:unnamed protein product [Bodo saltans]|uniref:Uncharacterized protein n=1 Tax=Bodo saltans TaxID=75058 RepID=A0A0S4IR11_BODSA|nr:unnamed protein product [Bodo saltans]|eukprot:CUF99846.1 unnamed protein product [Bodo saltans]